MDNLQIEKKEILSQWIADYGQMVSRTAFYYVKDQMMAEDIAQEVFIRAYRNMDSYRKDGNLSAWLYRITVNVSKDYLNSWKYRKQMLLQRIPKPDNQESAEEEAMKKLNRDELTSQVMTLPLKYREVIVLHYYEHLKSREIADLLQIKETTVRSRIHRGVSHLKVKLTGGTQLWMI